MDLTWHQRNFKNSIELNSPLGKAGEIIMSYLSQWEAGEIFGQKMKFKSQGIFKKKIQILDLENRSEIGLIKYNLLSNKGTVIMPSGEMFLWKCGMQGWAISSYESKGLDVSQIGKPIIDCKGLVYNGTVKYEESSELLLLSGFYLVSKFIRYPALLAIILYCYLLMLYFK